jgi:hypothetical protein
MGNVDGDHGASASDRVDIRAVPQIGGNEPSLGYGSIS